MLCGDAADARWTRQVASIGYEIKILAHFERAIVAGVIHAIGFGVTQSRNDAARQIIGVDVVGIAVFVLNNSGGTLLQALQGQTIRRINARHTQNAGVNAIAFCPASNLLFCYNATLAARTFRMGGARFVDQRATAIAINAAGADVDELSR